MKKAVFYSTVIAVGALITFFAVQEDSEKTAQAPAATEVAQQIHPATPPLPEKSTRTPAVADNTAAQALPEMPLEVPTPPDADPQAPRYELSLWQIPDDAETVEVEEIPAMRFYSDPENLEQLRVGQTLSLPVSSQGQPVLARITSTHNDPAGVQVWLAEVQDAQPGSNVILTRGQVETHVVIASEQGTYSAVINNRSGETTLINEGEIHSRVAPFDDGVVVGPEDDVPPPILP